MFYEKFIYKNCVDLLLRSPITQFYYVETRHEFIVFIRSNVFTPSADIGFLDLITFSSIRVAAFRIDIPQCVHLVYSGVSASLVIESRVASVIHFTSSNKGRSRGCRCFHQSLFGIRVQGKPSIYLSIMKRNAIEFEAWYLKKQLKALAASLKRNLHFHKRNHEKQSCILLS